MIQHDSHESNYFINGWDGLQDDGRRLVFVAAISIRVSDTILTHMSKDGRPAKRINEVERAAFEVMMDVANMPLAVWDVFAKACYDVCTLLCLQS